MPTKPTLAIGSSRVIPSSMPMPARSTGTISGLGSLSRAVTATPTGVVTETSQTRISRVASYASKVTSSSVKMRKVAVSVLASRSRESLWMTSGWSASRVRMVAKPSRFGLAALVPAWPQRAGEQPGQRRRCPGAGQGDRADRRVLVEQLQRAQPVAQHVDLAPDRAGQAAAGARRPALRRVQFDQPAGELLVADRAVVQRDE